MVIFIHSQHVVKFQDRSESRLKILTVKFDWEHEPCCVWDAWLIYLADSAVLQALDVVSSLLFVKNNIQILYSRLVEEIIKTDYFTWRSAEDKLSSLTAWGERLLCSLVVQKRGEQAVVGVGIVF